MEEGFVGKGGDAPEGDGNERDADIFGVLIHRALDVARHGARTFYQKGSYGQSRPR